MPWITNLDTKPYTLLCLYYYIVSYVRIVHHRLRASTVGYSISSSLTYQSIPDPHYSIYLFLRPTLSRPARIYTRYCFPYWRELGSYVQYSTSKRKNIPPGATRQSSLSIIRLVSPRPALTTTARPRYCETEPDRILVTPDPPRASSSHPSCELFRPSSAIRLCYLRLLPRRRPTAILAHPNWILGRPKASCGCD